MGLPKEARLPSLEELEEDLVNEETSYPPTSAASNENKPSNHNTEEQKVNESENNDSEGLDLDEDSLRALDEEVESSSETDGNVDRNDATKESDLEGLDISESDSQESEEASAENNSSLPTPKPNAPKQSNKITQKIMSVPKMLWGFVVAILDKCSALFKYLKKVPLVGRFLEPIKTGTALARGIIAFLLVLVFAVLPMAISAIFFRPSLDSIEGVLPDNGKVSITGYKVSDDHKTLTVDVANKGDVIAHNVKPQVSVSSKHFYNPVSWFIRSHDATCSTNNFSELNIDESRSIALTCDNPISGYSHGYKGTFVDIQ